MAARPEEELVKAFEALLSRKERDISALQDKLQRERAALTQLDRRRCAEQTRLAQRLAANERRKHELGVECRRLREENDEMKADNARADAGEDLRATLQSVVTKGRGLQAENETLRSHLREAHSILLDARRGGI